MLRLTLFFCLLSAISYSQNSGIVYLQNQMMFQGYRVISYDGKVIFRLPEDEQPILRIDPQNTNGFRPRFMTFDFDSGLLPVNKNGNYHLINRTGSTVIDFGNKYSKVFAPSCGLICAQISSEENNQERFVFLDSIGNKAFNGKQFYNATAFTDGISIVKEKKKGAWKIINTKGELHSKLSKAYRKHIVNIHSINDGRIIATVKKPRFLSINVYDYFAVLFDYEGNVIFTADYIRKKSKYLNLRNKNGLIELKTNESNDYYDKNGNYIQSFPKDMYVHQSTKDYYLLSDSEGNRKLLNLNLEEVKLPSPGNQFKSYIGYISDFGVTVSHVDTSEEKLSFTHIYEPITFKKIYRSPNSANPRLYSKDRIVVLNYGYTIDSIYDLNHNRLYKISPEDRVYQTLEEALKEPKNVQFLNLYETTDFTGLDKLKNLKTIRIISSNIRALPNFSSLTQLNFIDLIDCPNLTSLPQGIHSTKLKYLFVSRCHNIKLKTIIPELKYLKFVYLNNYIKIDKEYRDLIKFLRPDIEFRTIRAGNFDRMDLK